MRIGIDLLGAQSPHHGRRGIGRYARDLVSALVARPDGGHYFLHRRPALGTVGIEDVISSDRATWRDLPACGDGEAAASSDSLVRDDPDGLDAWLLASPFESWNGYLPPSRTEGGPALVAVLYDLIPFLAPPDGIPIHPDQRRLPHAARALKRFDALLAISESTRRDAIRLLDLDPSRVVAIGSAADDARFGPGDAPSAHELAQLGIDRPYVFTVGGMDARKNFHGLAEAFARLPAQWKESHKLVLACDLSDQARDEATRTARQLGITGSLVLVGEVSDALLARLYRGCAAFAFPSLYEGFGLPVLEAMKCGAAVVAGDNSSLPEVVGDDGLLADSSDPKAFGAALGQILSDPILANELRARALARSAQFSWSAVAEKARAAIAEAVAHRGEVVRSRPRITRARPRLAMVTPLPPRASGISDYSARLIDELQRDYRIDLFHDGAYTPLPALADPDLVSADARLLPRMAAVRNYRAIVYQMGNSRFHQFFYPLMLAHPGVVTLHDFCLAGFHQAYGYLFGIPPEHFETELQHGHAGRYDDLKSRLGRQAAGPSEALTRACAERGLWVNRRVFEAAETVVVHSPWCVERAREQAPEFADKSVVVPMGTTLAHVDSERRAATRARFGLPANALVVASFGYVHPDKMNAEAIAAFASVAAERPDALFAFVGQEADGGEARASAERCGVADRVRFLGRRSLDDFHALAEACDVGVNLRRPPTNGETSAALLDLIRWGVPTIVTDVATFADYPDAIVAKVDGSPGGRASLEAAMRALMLDPDRRHALGSAAHEHVRRHHQWPDVAARYAEVIESAFARRPALRGAS